MLRKSRAGRLCTSRGAGGGALGGHHRHVEVVDERVAEPANGVGHGTPAKGN